MKGEFILEQLRNDLLTVRAEGGKVLLQPKARVTPKHRDLVRQHKAEVLRALSLWPDSVAPANRLSTAPWQSPVHLNHDEQGARDRARPQVVIRRPRE